MADLSTPSSFLRINNITLKVPPKNISIIKNDYNASISTLRSQISTHVKSGHRTIGIIIETYFGDGYNAIGKEEMDGNSWVNEQLAPLLIQARKCPFVSIENEKLRKEIFGATGLPTSKNANMAAVIKSITVEKRAREPGIYNVRFYMEWFNYLPFSHKFGYKEVLNNGAIIETDVPGNQFEEFYKHGATIDLGTGTDKISRLVNIIDPPTEQRKEDDLTIIYKEYKRINLDSIDVSKDIEKMIRLDFEASEEIVSPLRSNLSQYDSAIQTLRNAGWNFVDEFEASENEPGRILFRYRMFTVPAVDPSEQLTSGRLIVESASSTLETKTVTIPLLGHTLPTAQFLGAADGNLVINFFANAELEKGLPEGKAIATSDNLATLNAIIELMNINAVKYRRIAKNDSVFIKHPSAKLLKYKRYDETRISVYNDDTKQLENFDIADFLACIVQSTESHTVEGLPYCSRFSLKLTENYKIAEGVSGQDEKEASREVGSATKLMIKTLIDKYDIQPRTDKTVSIGRDTSKKGKESVTKTFEDTSGKYVSIDAGRKGIPTDEPDLRIAQRLAAHLDASLSIKSFDDSKEVIDDTDFIGRSNKEIDEEYASAVTIRDASGISQLAEEDQERLKQTNSREELLEVANSIRRRRKTEFRGTRENRSPVSNERLNALAWDLIRIISKKGKDSKILNEYEEPMQEFRRYNLIDGSSAYPDMLIPKEKKQPDYFFYNSGDFGVEEHKKKVLEKTFERYEEVGKSFAKNLSDQEAPLVLSPEFRGSPGPPAVAPNLLSLGSDQKRKEEADTDKAFAQDPLNSDLQFENIKNTVRDFTDKTYTMRRSMPAFKLLVKDGDISSFGDIDKDRLRKKGKKGHWRNFTEFYDLNAIIDIRLVKTKENPADILVIRMANTREDIINKSYQDLTSRLSRLTPNLQKTKPPSGETEGKEKKADLNQLDGVMLKEGARIEFRLGYEGDPNDMGVEFSGRVSQIGGGDVVEIVCQGDGIELIQELKGVGIVDEFSWSSNTQNLINELLHNSPEIKNFGTINAKTALGDIPFFWKGAGGRTAIENIFAPSLFSTWGNFGAKTSKWTSRGLGIGLLFGPLGALAGSILGGAIGVATDVKDSFYKFFKGSKFSVYEQTIWDILQELTLRHPGTICDVVPFDRRSTIYFGYPDQLYFFRGPNFAEALAMDGDDLESSIGGAVEKNLQEVYVAKNGVASLSRRNSKKEIRRRRAKEAAERVPSMELQEPDIVDLKGQELVLSFMKQYRSYHMITSEHDIIENGMIANSDGVFNSVQVAHPSSSGDGNYDGSEGFSGYELTDEIKGDDDLNRDYIKRQTLVFHNAHTDIEEVGLPEKYAVSSLCRSLNNVYKGKIKILGRAGIKPHDIIFLYDTYNNVFGPVEVASVVHIFSYGTGWITEIVPHMIVTPTTTTSIVHINAIQRLVSSFYLKNIKLFYSGPIFRETGELDEDVGTENLGREISGESFLGNAVEGAAIGTTAIVTARAGKDVQRARKWGRVVQGAQKTKALRLLSGGGKLVFGRLAGASLPIVGDLIIDYATGFYTNWSKFRQPIAFIPVTRNGKPWYTGLYGLNNNTESEAITGIKTDLLKKGDFYINYMKDQFSEIFD